MIRALAMLGDPDVFVTAIGVFAVWLWGSGLFRTLGGLIAGLVVVITATIALKAMFATPGATLWPDGALISQYFPSGHAALATAIYGALAIILAAASGGGWRYAPLGALVLSVAVAAGRVIAGLHPIGDAFFGVVLGLAAPVITYFGVTREPRPLPHAGRIFAVFVAAFVAGWLLPIPVHRWGSW